MNAQSTPAEHPTKDRIVEIRLAIARVERTRREYEAARQILQSLITEAEAA